MQQRGPEGPRRGRGRDREKQVPEVPKGGVLIQQEGGEGSANVANVGAIIQGPQSVTVGGQQPAQPGAPTGQPTPARPEERRPREGGGGRAEEARRTIEAAKRAVGYFLKNLVYPFLEANKMQKEGKSEGTEEEIQKLKNYIHENFKKQRKPVGFIENLRKALESKEREGVTFRYLESPQLTEEDKKEISEALNSNDVIFVFVKEGENVVGFEVIFHLAKTGENVVKGYFKREYYRSHEEEIKALANQLQNIEKKS
jgi:hypothetical protein